MYTIYCIKCLSNNKVYIGKTTNLKNRTADHLYRLKANIHDNPYMQQDYNKYGFNEFKVSSICDCVDNESATYWEDYWIDYYGGIESNSNYNCKNSKTNNNSMITKLKHTAKESHTYGNKGKHLSSVTKQKISKANKGLIRTEQTRQKLRDAAKLKTCESWNKGKKGLYVPSIETRQKISKANKGKVFTEQHRLNISKARKGKPSHIKYNSQLAKQLKQEYYNISKNEYNINTFKQLSCNHNISYYVCKNLILYGKAYPSKEYKTKVQRLFTYSSSELEAGSIQSINLDKDIV